jgi:hypothetical protein
MLLPQLHACHLSVRPLGDSGSPRDYQRWLARAWALAGAFAAPSDSITEVLLWLWWQHPPDSRPPLGCMLTGLCSCSRPIDPGEVEVAGVPRLLLGQRRVAGGRPCNLRLVRCPGARSVWVMALLTRPSIVGSLREVVRVPFPRPSLTCPSRAGRSRR